MANISLMLDKLNFWLPAIGTFSILIPIAIGILAYNKSQLVHRALTAILLTALLLIFGLYCYLNKIDISDTTENARYAIYALVETLFYLWFMIKISDCKKSPHVLQSGFALFYLWFGLYRLLFMMGLVRVMYSMRCRQLVFRLSLLSY
ncbi:MAG: hypothetical protein IPP29_03280 [Bacteroidetes bacterium]|nr:hypothetical protein [Bacteroidota bacterium]